ncbi:MAG: ribonuclease P protein component [Chloroflexota bacterium]|nr:ribonuclease P protein component [Chloroflexota bacterium]MDE2868983.1 ribonuclease P protein component [Chloroflexota bacterium]
MNRRNRLRRARDIFRVRTRGAKSVTPSLVLFAATGEGEATRAAVPVSKRFGSAVRRNRLRRRVRESLRRELAGLPGVLDIVALPRKRAVDADSEELTAAVRRGLRQSQARLVE